MHDLYQVKGNEEFGSSSNAALELQGDFGETATASDLPFAAHSTKVGSGSKVTFHTSGSHGCCVYP